MGSTRYIPIRSKGTSVTGRGLRRAFSPPPFWPKYLAFKAGIAEVFNFLMYTRPEEVARVFSCSMWPEERMAWASHMTSRQCSQGTRSSYRISPSDGLFPADIVIPHGPQGRGTAQPGAAWWGSSILLLTTESCSHARLKVSSSLWFFTKSISQVSKSPSWNGVCNICSLGESFGSAFFWMDPTPQGPTP